MKLANSLDPADWTTFASQGSAMFGDMCHHMASLRQQPVWQHPPIETRLRHRSGMPQGPSNLTDVYAEFIRDILPYASGNAHPGFMGWVQGGGTPVGMVAEMLAAGLNVNAGGRDHMAIEIEREVVGWARDLVGLPSSCEGLLVTGTSAANLIAVLAARAHVLGGDSRGTGLVASGHQLRAYASKAAHGCIARAMDMAGIGSDNLRLVAMDDAFRIDLAALSTAIAEDRAAGMTPFLVVGNAGTVDTGAIDDLSGLADLAEVERLTFHVDGAYGALALLAPDLASRLAGIERADSIAFDWHKWGQVPYDAGCILMRDGARLRGTFAADAVYLRRAETGMAAGDFWPCDYGPDLSRGFRALKVWFAVKTYGTDALGHVISRTCLLARYLSDLIVCHPELELLAPTSLNIVCFGFRSADPDTTNAAIVEQLHAEGRVAPSLTRISGRVVIRAALVNHRTDERDVAALVHGVVRAGREIAGSKAAAA